ncbi:MAG: type IV pilus secretin PilQ [Methylovulum sp.]|nr:type IV pilus secretin PilQ [Methylovulum sp.]MCF7998852.1 type IV pilus secretin PilQ [Methylovulum sp.]
MNKIQISSLFTLGRLSGLQIALSLLILIFHSTVINANDLALSKLEVTSMAGDKLQIQLEMTAAAVAPKVFHTDNPARIALDFVGVKNALNKKIFPINQGLTTSVYVAEAADRVRVVVNLLESMPFETQVIGNKVLLTLSRASSTASPVPLASKTSAPVKPPIVNISNNSVITNLLPQQAISGFDFKRGDKNEGRILISLANPNTVVNTKEEAGKVVISFMNTRIANNLAKRLDVSEFATPVKFIDTVSSNQETKITVTTQNSFYDYSLFQSDGLLTVEFRPLSTGEKEALDKSRTKYTGERLSLNFQEIDIRSVIAILAEFTGQNVVAGDEVTGGITLKLDDVPWDEALDFVMMTKGLEKYETGNVTLVAPVGKIKEYKEKQKETELVVEQLDPLVTEYIQINYAKAENFRNLLYGNDTGAFGSCSTRRQGSGSSGSSGSAGGSSSASSMGSMSPNMPNQNQNQNQTGQGSNNNSQDRFKLLSSRGSAVVDARTNTLIVRETAKRLEDVKQMIRKLDVTVRQVMIESRIVIASNSFAKELGVRFGVVGDSAFASTAKSTGTLTGSAISAANTAAVTATTEGNTTSTGSINGTGILNDALVDLGTKATPYGALGMTLARGADYVLNLELKALQDNGQGELISNPRVMTTDRCQAIIKQGVQIPYQTSSANQGVNIQFAEAVLQLSVTPQVTPSGSIIMDLYISKDAVGDLTNGVPSIDTRNVSTNVRVNDGETVVLGGIYEGSNNSSINKVPFFGDLPGIGYLFKHTLNNESKKELLIFVTPKVMKDGIDFD